MTHPQRPQDDPLHQVAQKRKREPQDDIHELGEPLEKRFVKNAAPVHDLHSQPSTSAATSTDEQTIVQKTNREVALHEQVETEEKLPSTSAAESRAVTVAQKRKREPRDDIHELGEPLEKRFIKNAAPVHDLHSRPSTSAATSTDEQTIVQKTNREVAPHELVETEEKLPSTSAAKSRAVTVAGKRQKKAGTRDKLEKPLKKRLFKNAVPVHDLHTRPSTSAATSTDEQTIAEKREKEAVQEEKLRKLNRHLEERYIVNAAVLPDFRPRPASFAATASGTSSTSESVMEKPLLIHGLSVSDCQKVYHSVVDRKLVTSTGNLRCYSITLGRSIKQRLWETLNCPSVIEEEQIHDSEQIHYTEKFSTPTLKCFIPCYDLDTSDEPKPVQPHR